MTAGLSDRGAETPVCPLCGAGAHHVLSANGFSILDCSACGHRFSRDAVHAEHLEAVYDDQYFFGGGAGYEDYLVEADLLRAQGARYGRLLARHAPPGRVLDVGCAAGFVQAGLADAGWQTTGLEPNGTMAAHARSTLGLEVHQGGLEEAPDWPPFDAVCLIQVIGHFYDLPRALDAVRALTRPGGLCLVEYWRRDSWIARLLGRRWHEYSPPSVLHWFSRDSLDRALRDREFGHIAPRRAEEVYLGRPCQVASRSQARRNALGRACETNHTAYPLDGEHPVSGRRSGMASLSPCRLTVRAQIMQGSSG